MAASRREIIMLRSTGKNKAGKSTGYFIISEKNKANTTDKISLRKFDPRAYNNETGKCGMMVTFKESKVK